MEEGRKTVSPNTNSFAFQCTRRKTKKIDMLPGEEEKLEYLDAGLLTFKTDSRFETTGMAERQRDILTLDISKDLKYSEMRKQPFNCPE